MVHPTLRKGIVTSGFGMRASGWHGGIDYGGLPVGTPIYSSYAGVVTNVNANCPQQGYYCSSCGNGGGNWIEITSGNIKTKYMHLSSVYVKLGQSVSAGQNIGALGNSGCSTAAHLHFELWINGSAVNPAPYLQTATDTASASNNLPTILIAGLLFYLLYE